MPGHGPGPAGAPQRRPAYLSAEPDRADEIEALFERHHATLVRALRRRLVCPRALGEDAVGHAWLQLWRSRRPTAIVSSARCTW
jgi:DNA-directed RNA polymerase specialized sigma24 family protein